MESVWNLADKLSLSFIKGLNSNFYKTLINKYESFDDLLDNINTEPILSKIVQNSLFNSIEFSNLRDSANREIEACQKESIRIIDYWNDDYPNILRDINSAPMFIYVKGALDLNSIDNISIVGTRRVTHYGKLVCESFTEKFVQSGFCITSGLAAGIDTIAHSSALKHKGATIAVIASGINKISPYISAKLAKDIAANGGAVVSEYKLNTAATPAYFPQRNRIISGLSKATLVVESGERGGSLITARFAFDQNRSVYAVPGNLNSEKSKGANALIQKNIASIAISPEQILEDLGYMQLFKKESKNANAATLSEIERIIIDNLNSEPIHIDILSDKTGIPIIDLSVKLLDMEFRDLIKQLPGKYYILPL